MSDDPTEAAIRREIIAARKILREDRLIGKLDKAFPEEAKPDTDGPPPPPEKDPPDTPVKKGIWWGEPK